MTTNGSVEDQVLANAGASGRDVRNHMLFEVSTEAANRGEQGLVDITLMKADRDPKSEESIP